MIVTADRMREAGLNEEEVTAILDQYALADARWQLLHEVIGDRKCENPAQYGADCGTCLVCRCRYLGGALLKPPEARNKAMARRGPVTTFNGHAPVMSNADTLIHLDRGEADSEPGNRRSFCMYFPSQLREATRRELNVTPDSTRGRGICPTCGEKAGLFGPVAA